MPDYPLDGLRCIELSERGAAAYAGKLLHRLGAELTKLEPPEGDPLRRRMSRRAEGPAGATTAAFDFFNDGKRTRVLREPSELRSLVAGGDALVLDLELRRYEAWGLTPEALRSLDCAVVCAITPFGLSGPYRDFRGGEIVTSAFGGSSVGIGQPGRAPLKMPMQQTAIQSGLVAALAVMGALLGPRPADGARVIDVSETDVWATIHTGTTVVSYLFSHRLRTRQGRRVLGQPYPHQLFRCKDGWIAIQASERHQFEAFIDMVGEPEWAGERRFGTRLQMNDQRADEVDALLAPWFEQRTRTEIFELCRARNIPAAPARRVDEVRTDPDLIEYGAFERYTGAAGVDVTVPAPPFRFRSSALRPAAAVPRLAEAE